METEFVRDFVIVDPDDEDVSRRLAAEHGVRVETATVRGEPITTVTLMLIGVPTAVAVVMAMIERHKGGQVIDLRPGAPQVVFRSREVVYGLVVILAADGSVQVEVKQPEELFTQVVDSLVAMLGDLAGKGVDAIAERARTSVGESGNVTVIAAKPEGGERKLPSATD